MGPGGADPLQCRQPHPPLLRPDAAIPTRIGFFALSRDRLAIEVKGLTAAPDAAVYGADFTPDEAAVENARAAGAEALP
jgi:hypothetical protein